MGQRARPVADGGHEGGGAQGDGAGKVQVVLGHADVEGRRRPGCRRVFCASWAMISGHSQSVPSRPVGPCCSLEPIGMTTVVRAGEKGLDLGPGGQVQQACAMCAFWPTGRPPAFRRMARLRNAGRACAASSGRESKEGSECHRRRELTMSSQVFPVPAAWARAGTSWTAPATRRRFGRVEADPHGYWARVAGPPGLDLAVQPGQGRLLPPRGLPYPLVRRRRAETPEVNCLDRHLATRADDVAIIWEGDDPADSRRITYRRGPCRSLPHGQCAQGARRGKGRPGQ